MGRLKEPTALIKAKGKSHISAAEIEERLETEVVIDPPKFVKAPAWLPSDLRASFKRYARQLIALRIFATLDADTLARYVIAQKQWEDATEIVREALDSGDLDEIEKASKVQDKYFKQVRGLSQDLGMTISSRCRLVIPKATDDDEADSFGELLAGKAGE